MDRVKRVGRRKEVSDGSRLARGKPETLPWLHFWSTVMTRICRQDCSCVCGDFIFTPANQCITGLWARAPPYRLCDQKLIWIILCQEPAGLEEVKLGKHFSESPISAAWSVATLCGMKLWCFQREGYACAVRNIGDKRVDICYKQIAHA